MQSGESPEPTPHRVAEVAPCTAVSWVLQQVAAPAVDSASSRNPAGTVHCPMQGSMPRRQSRIRPSCSTMQPTTCQQRHGHAVSSHVGLFPCNDVAWISPLIGMRPVYGAGAASIGCPALEGIMLA